MQKIKETARIRGPSNRRGGIRSGNNPKPTLLSPLVCGWPDGQRYSIATASVEMPIPTKLDLNMRFDKRLHQLTEPTPVQRYFLSCWFNMVHEYSVDSFRVRVMNPGAIVREIQRALSFAEAKPEDKVMILEEAQQLLQLDRVLKHGPFPPVLTRLLKLLASDKTKILAAKTPEERLLFYTLNEFAPILEQHYIPLAFKQLEELLVIQETGVPTLDTVHAVTGSLLSALLDHDFSLESLYRIYAEVLVPRAPKGQYRFDRKLGLARVLLTQPKKIFHVTFAVDQISRPDEWPVALGRLEIAATAPFALHARHAKTTYLNAQAKRRFITVRDVRATDRRAAGLQAYDQLADVINLLRFEYEQAKLVIPEQFAVLENDRATEGGRVYHLPRVVPNPTLTLNGTDVAAFVSSVNELIGGSHFGDEGRDRITSAFRLYRQGKDQDTFETKLVHWWTALEYLVRGSQAGSGIGKSVETYLAPVVGLSYAPKVLLALRNLLLDLGIALTDGAGAPIDFRGMTLKHLWDLFRDPSQQETILAALALDPFLQEQTHQVLSDLATPSALLSRLKKHEQRVRWQMQRLWRTRCDIVHSAGRGSNHLLLCSNLESYLKTALHGVLASLHSLPTLSGPHEYFDREVYRYNLVLTALGAGQMDEARGNLSA